MQKIVLIVLFLLSGCGYAYGSQVDLFANLMNYTPEQHACWMAEDSRYLDPLSGADYQLFLDRMLYDAVVNQSSNDVLWNFVFAGGDADSIAFYGRTTREAAQDNGMIDILEIFEQNI